MVHTRGCDLVEIILGDEGAPVLRQNSAALFRTEDGAERPFINGSISNIIKD
jgi:hypothetical protein